MKELENKKHRDEMLEKLSLKFMNVLQRYLDSPELQKIAPPPAAYAEAMTAIGMCESSKKIDRYSKWLVGCTIALVVATIFLVVLNAILIWKTPIL